MTGVQEQVFQCLRSVAEYANNNRSEGLQTSVDRAEEVAMLEILGIGVATPIEIEEPAQRMKMIASNHSDKKA